VRARRSVRAFLPDPVPEKLIRDVLEDAALAPSNCNVQPWHVHIFSGAARDALSRDLIEDLDNNRMTFDFVFDASLYEGLLGERRRDQGKKYFEALSMGREDAEGRRIARTRNLEFFGAPHAALLFMPQFGDNVRIAGDIGMYGQTFLLALAARGLGGIPQTMLGFFSDTVRRELGVDPSLKLLFGISFGYEDTEAHANTVRMSRAPLSECVTFHE
jgi:nitroreductase